ncbi:hypothetical protein BC834DRAFT_888243 [Gloeopeniophorella convolvens]|nr:hypothetical protein BC834DRAFT_888243 [Gloeopeniophorella convolvens]
MDLATPAPLDVELDAPALHASHSHHATVLQSHSARAEARSAIQQKVNAARSLIHQWNIQMNDLLPISRLPPELLGRIFYHHASIEPPFYNPMRRLGWIRDTHVYRGPYFFPKWAAEMLIRAKQAPLCFFPSYTPTRVLFFLMFQALPRIREIRFLHVSAPEVQDDASALLLSAAPVLERLTISATDVRPLTVKVGHGMKLFGGHAPNLERLVLRDTCVPWLSIPQCRLSHLEVVQRYRRPSDFDDIAPSFGHLDGFIDVLASSPTLEVLILEWCTHSLSESLSTRVRPIIDLPRLRQLQLAGQSNVVNHILSPLSLTGLRNLHLVCTADDPLEMESWLKIIPNAVALFQRTAITLKSLGVTAENGVAAENEVDSRPTLVKIQGSCDPPASLDDLFKSYSPEPNLYLHLMSHLDGGCDYISTLVEEVCAPLPLDQLEFLCVSASWKFSGPPPDWAQLFQRCLQVTSIYMFGRESVGLLVAINPRTELVSKENSINSPYSEQAPRKRTADTITAPAAFGTVCGPHQAIPFPVLTTLILDRVDFDMKIRGSREQVVARRKALQLPIESLAIRRCAVKSDSPNTLANLVPEFEWDGWRG